MRRKNMLALGMSLVFCTTSAAVPLYANPLDNQEITVSEEWVDVNGSKYYLFPNSDGWKGRMLTGWQWIDGNCYYLDSQGQNEGALYRNTTTPDGYAVDAEGRWVVNGEVQKK